MKLRIYMARGEGGRCPVLKRRPSLRKKFREISSDLLDISAEAVIDGDRVVESQAKKASLAIRKLLKTCGRKR